MVTKKLAKKKKSKRVSTQKRLKLTKKINSKKSKMRRQYRKIKKHRSLNFLNKRKELKVPNLFPYKKHLLLQLQRSKQEEMS